MEVWYLLAAEEVVRAGVLSYAPGSESEHVSLVSPFMDWSRFVGLCLFVGGGLFAFVLFFLNRWPICAIVLSTDD